MPSDVRTDSLRSTWLVLHRWLGLGVFVFFAVASLTGAVLVYEHELDGWINRGVYRTTPGDVGVARVIAGAQRAAAGDVVSIRWPTPRMPVYVVELGAADDIRRMHIDPGTGEVLERTRPSLPIIPLVRRAHTTLLARRPGHYLVLIASVLALISMVTGLILWWPGVKRITRGFSVRLRRGFYPLNYDLHQAAGALALPLLFVITLTGVLIPYQRQAEMVLRIALGDAGAVERTPVTVPPLVQPGPTDLVERAQHIVPDGRPTMLRMPATGGNAQVDVLRGGHGVAGGTVSVMLDPTDASIVSVRDPRTASDARRLAGPFNFNVHIGAVGGPLVRVLYVIVCLMGAAVAVTGFTIWWLKRTRVGENATAIVASAVR